MYVYNSYVSFLGEVDPVEGVLKPRGDKIAGSAFAFKGGRGSTVGSYVIYALKYYGRQPACMVVEEPEPIIITGCIMADIPLFQVGRGVLNMLSSRKLVLVHKIGEDYVELVEE
ncbi:aconitase X swivel domain-containing protein [Thermogladius sp. 4427co]|uniref:aconitase X swivel domain-containing protein n=1 Tax=Thermogladius sp. 4427co TaxID=3450718 RepID=UPI003F79C01F